MIYSRSKDVTRSFSIQKLLQSHNLKIFIIGATEPLPNFGETAIYTLFIGKPNITRCLKRVPSSDADVDLKLDICEHINVFNQLILRVVPTFRRAAQPASQLANLTGQTYPLCRVKVHMYQIK